MSRIEIIGNATQRVTAIYALCEYPAMTPRYVGKTVQYLHERHKAHIRDARRGSLLPVHYWIRKQIAAGKRLAISLIEYVQPGEDWASRERHWIKAIRDDGGALLNLTDGGEGLAGRRMTDAHKAKIAAAIRTGATCACIRCGKSFWRKANQIAKGQAKFCSRQCSNIYNKGGRRGA
jgi:hypothetical protein